MSIVDEKSIFIAMKQDGPFAVRDQISFEHPFSRQNRLWARTFHHNRQMASKYRAVRDQLFDLLQIESFDEIPDLIQNPLLRAQRSERAYRLLGNLFGISGELSEIRGKIHEYMNTADAVIGQIRNKVLAAYSSNIEISNEIETSKNPVDLLLMIFDDRYHKKIRFEAKRKLVLMGLAGSIDQRERETDIENKFSAFLSFLNQFVWSPQLKIGELEIAYLASRHDSTDFSCTEVDVIDAETARHLHEFAENEKLTLVKRRLFHSNGQEIPVYVTVRKKDSAAKVLKLLRKNEKNPAAAVDDELGLMAVLDNVNHIKRLVRHLTRAAVKAGSMMILEDISDTLAGNNYDATSVGSSNKTQMLKFFARMGGMRVEFIIHTNQSYLNYRYQRGTSHDEYEVRRLFDSGVTEFLFPYEIYRLDMTQVREKQLQRFRKIIEQQG
ncbi:hypothetical protein [Thiothrix lacustris]|uniref:Uncharacterized protein n=1 Tax=Thiothrix lacustris TaxID=525917 RepID=A0ABY9MMQ9_9GAMM|nr:hypothetical protein [Thiothrix lacustris]WML89939.1 hypothetical protein RCF98_13290 [Thiothrix lacustris]WMP18455.1 hypothetical protein RCS87_05190 [Thiothrix lacustris]